jgi:hypothetical protein
LLIVIANWFYDARKSDLGGGIVEKFDGGTKNSTEVLRPTPVGTKKSTEVLRPTKRLGLA